MYTRMHPSIYMLICLIFSYTYSYRYSYHSCTNSYNLSYVVNMHAVYYSYSCETYHYTYILYKSYLLFATLTAEFTYSYIYSTILHMLNLVSPIYRMVIIDLQHTLFLPCTVTCDMILFIFTN